MNVPKISAITFRGSNVETTDSTPKSKVKEFLHKKEAPYVIGAASIALIFLGILGVKKGKLFKPNTHTSSNGPKAPDANPKAPDVNPKAPDTNPKAPDTNPKAPDVNPKAPDTNPKAPDVNPKTPDANHQTQSGYGDGKILNMGPFDDSEVLYSEPYVPHVEVLSDEEIDTALVKEARKHPKIGLFADYLLKFMDKDTILEKASVGALTSLERFKYLVKHFDEKVSAQISSINAQYPIINNPNKGYRRTRAQMMEAFDKVKYDTNSNYDGTVITRGNMIQELRLDGSKVIYSFEDGENGALRSIRDIPLHNEGLELNVTFDPSRYIDLGDGIGIHKLTKMEFKNATTGKLAETISINPETNMHSVELYSQQTGHPVMKIERSSGDEGIILNAKMFDEDTGKLITNVSTEK